MTHPQSTTLLPTIIIEVNNDTSSSIITDILPLAEEDDTITCTEQTDDDTIDSSHDPIKLLPSQQHDSLTIKEIESQQYNYYYCNDAKRRSIIRQIGSIGIIIIIIFLVYVYVFSSNFFKELFTTTPKPRFVIHMGPLKTGTTTLEGDLAEMVWGKAILQTDNWNYLNVLNIHEDGTTISPDLSLIRFEDPNYFNLFKKEVKRLRTYNQNMVYVEEGFSVVFGDHPEYFNKLKHIFGNDWDVTIVLGYRPYFDWIPSTWYQAMKRNDWVYVDPATWPWKDENGNLYRIQTMFPQFYSWMSDITQFTDSIKEFASDRHFNVSIIDLYDERTLRSIFFCDILKAENTCEEIQRLDAEGGGIDDVVNRGSLDIVHYDSIGLAAASMGLVDIQKWNRIDILDAIQHHVEEGLHQSAKDLPMICPDEKTMTDLLEKSLRLDSLCLPEKHVLDPDRETKLRERFRINLEDEKKYCSIDKDALLESSEWRAFFEYYQW